MAYITSSGRMLPSERVANRIDDVKKISFEQQVPFAFPEARHDPMLTCSRVHMLTCSHDHNMCGVTSSYECRDAQAEISPRSSRDLTEVSPRSVEGRRAVEGGGGRGGATLCFRHYTAHLRCHLR